MKKVPALLLVLFLLCSLLPLTAGAEEMTYFGREQIAHAEQFADVRQQALDAYDRLLEGFNALTASIKLTDLALPSDVATKVYSLVRSDHPECFWTNNHFGYHTNSSSVCVSIEPNYAFTASQLPAAQANFTAVMARFLALVNSEMDDYTKALTLHDALAHHITYDLSVMDQTAYSVVTKGRGVCAGYAAAYQYLLQQVGIPAWTVVGLGQNESHAWNCLLLNGKRYYTDLTWDDTNDETWICYSYFNLPAKRMQEDHVPDELYADYTDYGADLTDTSQMYYDETHFLTRTLVAEDGTSFASVMEKDGVVRFYIDDDMSDGYSTANSEASLTALTESNFMSLLCGGYSEKFGVYGGLGMSYYYKGREIYVRLVSATGQTVSVDLVTLSTPDGLDMAVAKTVRILDGDEVIASVVTEKNTCSIIYVPVGTFTLEVSARGFASFEMPLTVASSAVNKSVTLCLRGDINADGKVNDIDATALLKHIKGTKLLDGYAFAVADLSGDGKVNAIDHTALLRHLKSVVALY